LTPRELRELYVLAREFRISAHDALHVRPAWELDNLLRQYAADRQREQS
jgi:phosphotransferase system HPr-like phosphotransfer protein